jgi:Lrp/AsnC family leucine-responsive transcriptional regulator
MVKNNNSRLDRTDRKILATIERDARVPVSELARKARVSRTVAEYRLKCLEQDGVIRGYYCLIDPSLLGFTVWEAWVTLHPGKDRKALFSYIDAHPLVWWRMECAGAYDAVICALCRTPREFQNFFRRLQDRYDNIITDAAVLMNVDFEYHTRGYLLGSTSRLLARSGKGGSASVRPTAYGLALLQALSIDSRASYVRLAQETGRNVKTVMKELASLRSAGIIVSFRPLLDVSLFGYEQYKVLLYLDNPHGGILPAALEWCRTHSNIVAIASYVGPWQLEIDIEIDTYRNLCALLAQLKEAFANGVRRHEVLLVTNESKAMRRPPGL